MKIHPSILPMVLLGACACASAQMFEPIAPAPVLPAPQPQPATPKYSLTTSKDWQNPAALRETLSKKILARLQDTDEATVKKFLASEYNRLLLANYMLVHAEICSEKAYADYQAVVQDKLNYNKNALEKLEKELPGLGGAAAQESARYKIDKLKGTIADIEAELRQPLRLADVVKRPRASRLINLIANDLGWIGDIVYSGECIMPGRMLNMLANMMERYTRMLPDDRLPRDIATATALEFARYGWSVDCACKRAEYFVRNWRLGRLHAGFDTLPFWQRRLTCGWKGEHSSGTPESFEWALNNVHLPARDYADSCWRCGYVLNNVYGDSVHGSAYYDAFEGMYIGRHHQFTLEVGGVCGSLSHFGAAAACANGVPGLTIGEPEHCAFVILADGKWIPAYSLSWQHDLHWQPWQNIGTYSTLHLTTDLYAKEQRQATRLSNAYRAMAHLLITKGETEQALACFDKAEKAQPLHFPVYREHAELLKTSKANDPAAWLKLNETICRLLVPLYAECGSTVVQRFVYDNLTGSGASYEQLQQAYELFWQNVNEMGPERWDLQALLNKQIAMLNQSRPQQQTDNVCSLFRAMLNNTISRKAYATISLECGNNLLKLQDEATKNELLAIMAQAITQGDSMDPEARTKALANAVLATESMRDLSAFQGISKLIDPAQTNAGRPIGDFDTFPGNLVSEGGMIFASSTSPWDQPLTHANVLTRQGGLVHTNNDQNAWVAIRLPKHAHVTGVVLAVHPDSVHWERLRNLQIQVSETGKNDDWHNVGQPIENCTQRILRFDLTAEQPKALYVRVIRPDIQDVFYIDGLFVFGTPAA